MLRQGRGGDILGVWVHPIHLVLASHHCGWSKVWEPLPGHHEMPVCPGLKTGCLASWEQDQYRIWVGSSVRCDCSHAALVRAPHKIGYLIYSTLKIYQTNHSETLTSINNWSITFFFARSIPEIVFRRTTTFQDKLVHIYYKGNERTNPWKRKGLNRCGNCTYWRNINSLKTITLPNDRIHDFKPFVNNRNTSIINLLTCTCRAYYVVKQQENSHKETTTRTDLHTALVFLVLGNLEVFKSITWIAGKTDPTSLLSWPCWLWKPVIFCGTLCMHSDITSCAHHVSDIIKPHWW